MRVRTRRRVAGLLAMVAAVAVAAGCAAVPTAGPIMEETLAPGQRDGRTDISVTNVTPNSGDSPVEIVRGFIEAMSSYQPGYAMAREFLTEQADARWRPDRRILVYDGALLPDSDRQNVVRLSGSEVGQVGDDGAWHAAASGTRLDQELTLKRVGTEWRIDRLPNQVLMTRTNFDHEFRSFNLFFFDSSFEILVPDPVFLPLRSNWEMALTSAVIRGPTRWLAPVLRSAVPPDSGLAVRSVQVEGKTARVDLVEPNPLTSDQHSLLAAQLGWTLRQAGVEKISFLVNKVPLADPGGSDRWTRYDPHVKGAPQAAYVFRDGKIDVLTGNRLMTGTTDALDYTPRAFAVAIRNSSPAEKGQGSHESDFGQVTVVGEDNRSLIVYTARNTSSLLLEDFPFHDIRALSSDRTGRLWVVDNDNGASRIVVIDESHKPSVVTVPGQQGSNIVDLKVSRDGTRVAMLVERRVGSGTRTSLLVGLVERGEPLRVRGLREVETGFTNVSDVAWSGSTELVVLVKNSTDDVNQVLRVAIDGSVQTVVNDAPAAPAAVAAAPGRPLLVVDESSLLSVEVERSPWLPLGQAAVPTYAG